MKTVSAGLFAFWHLEIDRLARDTLYTLAYCAFAHGRVREPGSKIGVTSSRVLSSDAVHLASCLPAFFSSFLSFSCWKRILLRSPVARFCASLRISRSSCLARFTSRWSGLGLGLGLALGVGLGLGLGFTWRRVEWAVPELHVPRAQAAEEIRAVHR